MRAYCLTGMHLLKKLPLNNPLLKRLSALDPIVKGNSKALWYMLELPQYVKGAINADERNDFQRQVQDYHACNTLPHAHEKSKLDKWWAIVMRKGYFPVLCKLVKSLLSCFHGPVVESSFSIMGNIIKPQTASLDCKTFDAIQTVKYSMKAAKKTPVQYFIKEDFIHDKVDPVLVTNVTSSYKQWKVLNEEKKDEKNTKNEVLGLKKDKVISKHQAKKMKSQEMAKERADHQDRNTRRYNKKKETDKASKKR